MTKAATQSAEAPKAGAVVCTTDDCLPERTCVVCRAVRPAAELVRLAATAGRLHVAAPREGGRGAWVCLSSRCLSELTAQKAARGLRQAVTMPERAEFLAEVEALAEQRVLETIGLARRQNALIVGADEVLSGQDQGGLVLIAADASEQVRKRMSGVGRGFVDSDKMSKAAGLHRAQALRIKPGRLSHQAAYWLSVWYECGARGSVNGQRAEVV